MFTTLIAFAAIALQQQPAQLTEAQKKETIEALITALNETYVFEELAKQAEAAVRAALAAGAYNEITSGAAFATKLSSDVNAILKDAHFSMRYSAEVRPRREDRREPSPAEIEADRKFTVRMNAGFEKVERLPGNIGYLEVMGFFDPEQFAVRCAAAFDFLATTDALILDLRRNGGGDPESVRILCSYLFGEKPVHLNSLYFRARNETTEFWTLETLPGKRYGAERPVFVLTSKRTGSGAEECSYNIQTQKRGLTVGESTWGGANPGGVVRLNDHFAAFIPIGRAINPITKTNWEGTGVKPDVDCPSSDALVRAQVMAIEEVMKTADEEWRSELARVLGDLKGDREGVIQLLRSVSSEV
jgi:C-terminal processing protease CtpA/Prc